MAHPRRLGKYEIRRPLGQGAMGMVYLGFDPQIERLVALKTIRVDGISPDSSSEFVVRFRNEARAAGRLQHPNIVGIYEYGAEESVAFIAMEYVEGLELGSYVRGRVGFDFEQAVALMDQLLGALEFAHRNGIVHRDIKPSNLMVTRDGTLKVTDFGVARIDTSRLTATGMVIGTPSYMSPEQCVGKLADARSDLFSAGVVLYELVTGERPFAGPAEAVAYKICHEHAIPPSRRSALRVPSALDGLVASALAKDPAQRFANAHAFRQELHRVAAGGSPLARDEDETRGLATLLPREEAPLSPNNLPFPMTSFVGRDRDIDEVTHLLRATRLLTLVGAGGLGKSRLAVETARSHLREHPDGVWLIELAAVADPRLVVDTIASALGVKPEPGQSIVEALTRFVSPRALLVILDNCEHLLSACAEIAKRLLEAGRDIKNITTSREPLHLAGESVFAVLPLPVPQAGALPALDVMRRIPAVQLFCDRAQAVNPQFALSARNAGAVVELCQRLDGIPLALELAAARVRTLPVEAIAARLGDRFRLLKGGDRTALPRQQTLRATIDWSHDLLTPPQQVLLRRLAAFAGGFCLEAAEAVGSGGDIAEEDVLDLLSDLVEKSLVVQDAERERYRLLETVRQYAQEKLDEAGEGTSARGRHLRYFVALAEEGDPEFFERVQGDWNVVLDRERDNLMAAHSFCSEASDGGSLGLRLVHALRNWLRRGSVDLGYRIATEALARTGAQELDIVRCRALFTAGTLCYFGGNYVEAMRFADESAAIASSLPDRLRVADALAVSGLAAFGQGDLARASNDLVAAVAIGRELADPMRLQQALNCLAEVQSSTGEIDAAQSNYEEALALAQRMGSRDIIATTKLNLVRIEMDRGSIARATDLLCDTLACLDEGGLAADCQQFLTVAAGLAAHRGEWERAGRFYGLAQAWLEQGAARREPADETFIAPLVARARTQAGDGFDRGEAAGRRLAFADAIVDARDWLGVA